MNGKHRSIGGPLGSILGFDSRAVFPTSCSHPLGVLSDVDENTGGGGSRDKGPTLTHSQCVAREREITSELERLQEMDTLSREDEEYFSELTDEFTVVDEHRKRLERDAALGKIKSAASSAHLRNIRPGSQIQPGASTSGTEYSEDAFLEPDSIPDARFRNPWDLSNMRTFGRSREDLNAEFSSRARSAIESMPQATDKIREAATNIVEKFDDKNATIARMVLAASSPEYVRAFGKMATNSEHLLSDAEKRAMDTVRAMSLTDNAGGYLVPFQLDPTVIVTANGSRNDIRQAARQVIATGDKWHGVTSGAVSWSWDGEATEVSDDSTTFGQPAIPVHKAQGFIPVSIEALEDEQNVASTVATLLAEGRDILEAAAFINGSGTGQPTGIVTALTGGSSVVPSAGSDTLALGDVYGLLDALPARYRRDASWLASNLFYTSTRQFDTNGGSALWAQLGQGRPATLLGRPVLEAEDMDGTVTATEDNYLAVVGAFQNYVIADRIGMRVEFIQHLFGSNQRPTGQRGWYAYFRVGADSVNDAAFRMLNVT